LEGIRGLGSRSVPRLNEITIHGDVLLFTLAISVAAGILFGLAPALRVSGPPSAIGGRGRYTRQLLVVSELALSVVVLVAAGLLIRSFARVQQVPAGFNPAHTLTLE